jgi:hypothetical protein
MPGKARQRLEDWIEILAPIAAQSAPCTLCPSEVLRLTYDLRQIQTAFRKRKEHAHVRAYRAVRELVWPVSAR